MVRLRCPRQGRRVRRLTGALASTHGASRRHSGVENLGPRTGFDAAQVTVARARLATLPPYARRARTYAKFGEHRAGASRGARDSPRASLCLFRAKSMTHPHLSPRRRQRHAQVQNVSIREAAPGFYPRASPRARIDHHPTPPAQSSPPPSLRTPKSTRASKTPATPAPEFAFQEHGVLERGARAGARCDDDEAHRPTLSVNVRRRRSGQQAVGKIITPARSRRGVRVLRIVPCGRRGDSTCTLTTLYAHGTAGHPAESPDDTPSTSPTSSFSSTPTRTRTAQSPTNPPSTQEPSARSRARARVARELGVWVVSTDTQAKFEVGDQAPKSQNFAAPRARRTVTGPGTRSRAQLWPGCRTRAAVVLHL